MHVDSLACCAQLAFSIQRGQAPLPKECCYPQYAGSSYINNLICLRWWISVHEIKLQSSFSSGETGDLKSMQTNPKDPPCLQG